jgi:hypothetical protein
MPAGDTAAGGGIEAVQFRRVNTAARPWQARPQLIAALGAERRRQIREGHSNGGTDRQRLESDS